MSEQEPGEWFQASPPQQPPASPGVGNWAPPQGPAVNPQPQAYPPPGLPAQPHPTNAFAATPNYQGPEAFNFESQTVHKKGARGGRLAVVGLSLALLGGAGLATKVALSEPAGPASPDEAADALFRALDDDDFVGVIELMAPSEREAYVEPSLDILQEFARLANEDIGDDVFNELPFDLEVNGVEYEVAELGPGVSWLSVTDGEMEITFKGDEIPAWMSDLGDQIAAPAERETETLYLEDAGLAFALVEEGGSWYWSGGYTIAENIRQGRGWDRPSFTGTDMARGADSPEAAVENMVYSLSDFDLRGAFTLLDPEEFGVLYDYSEFFLDDATEEFSSLRSEFDERGIEYSITDMNMRSSEIRGRTVVTVESFEASATDGYDSGSVSYRDGCMLLEFTGSETIDSCNETDLWEEFNGSGLSSDLNSSLADFESGITVVERDGKWYVSGGPTVLGFYADLLSTLTEEDWNAFTDSFGDFTDLMSGGVGGVDLFSLGSGDAASIFEETVDPTFDSEGATETTGPDEFAFSDFKEIDPVFVAPGYEFWTDPGSNSIGVFMYELDSPVTVTNLFDETSFIELAEYEAPYEAARLGEAMAAAYGCEAIGGGVMGDDVVRFSCNEALVARYGRWMVFSFETSPETEAMAVAQLAHLRSLGE